MKVHRRRTYVPVFIGGIPMFIGGVPMYEGS